MCSNKMQVRREVKGQFHEILQLAPSSNLQYIRFSVHSKSYIILKLISKSLLKLLSMPFYFIIKISSTVYLYLLHLL